MGGFLCEHGFAGGWPSIFYVLGTTGVIWSILWFIFSSNSPRENRFIKQNEIEYIEKENKNVLGSNLQKKKVS